jgi:hypothetical protein
LFSVTEA